jgi:GTP-binding protein HflX
LIDTIGFITDLPHELVNSFKSTLEEVFHSDVLLHIIDVSNPSFQFQRKVVYNVLDEIFPNGKESYKNRIVR